MSENTQTEIVFKCANGQMTTQGDVTMIQYALKGIVLSAAKLAKAYCGDDESLMDEVEEDADDLFDQEFSVTATISQGEDDDLGITFSAEGADLFHALVFLAFNIQEESNEAVLTPDGGDPITIR